MIHLSNWLYPIVLRLLPSDEKATEEDFITFFIESRQLYSISTMFALATVKWLLKKEELGFQSQLKGEKWASGERANYFLSHLTSRRDDKETGKNGHKKLQVFNKISICFLSSAPFSISLTNSP